MIKRIFCIVSLIIFTVVAATIIFVNTCNFGLGSNMEYYNTAFENQGTVWYSESNNLRAEVVKANNQNIMVIKTNTNDKFILLPLGYFDAELLEYSNTYDISKLKSLCTYKIKYIKRLGKICKFIMHGDDENVLTGTNGNIVFELNKYNKN